MDVYDNRATPQQCPPNLVPVLRERVDRAWLLPGGKTLAIMFANRKMLLLDALTTRDGPAVRMELGDEIPGARWRELDKECPQTPHTLALRGRRLTGMDGDVILFGAVGAAIKADGIHWVRKPD